MPVTCIHAVTSIPPLTSFPLSYIFIPLLFCTTAFSFTSAFCRVFGKCSFNSFPPVSSPSPAAHHTHPICSGPATCFLSFQIFHGNWTRPDIHLSARLSDNLCPWYIAVSSGHNYVGSASVLTPCLHQSTCNSSPMWWGGGKVISLTVCYVFQYRPVLEIPPYRLPVSPTA